MILHSKRLTLRRWRDEDRRPLARIHADPRVMEWQGRGPMSQAESDDYLARFEEHFDRHGFGLWAVERRCDGKLIGVVGLQCTGEADHPLVPCVEMVWRQDRQMWGHGYIAEAARAALADGFGRIGMSEVLAWTAATNLRSQAVMNRLGMVRDETCDFEVASLPRGHALRPHRLFRITSQVFACGPKRLDSRRSAHFPG